MERFDEYMERCLYGPDGFYADSGVAGRSRGDFITSPEVGPLFGAVIANALDTWWTDLGRPDPWTIYDAGCGPNSLLKAIRRARPPDTRPWNLVGVDIVPPVGGVPDPTANTGDPRRLAELPDELSGAVVLGNELLDNLPFRVVEHSNEGWFEVHVDDAQEHLCATEARHDIPVGTRAPLLVQADEWCRSVLERGPSHLCLFDYGTRTTEELATRGGWLRTYRKHQRGDDPFHQPGRWDITTDIAVDQLPPAAAVETQTDFLRRWGIDGLVDQGRSHWSKHAARPDLAAFAMRSRVSEAEALTDPSSLGSWMVIHYDNTGQRR